jgi:hypothetical protein
MQRYLIGDTDEARQRMREEIISTTAADIRKFADAMANVAAHGRVIVLGSEQAIEAANSEPPGLRSVSRVMGVSSRSFCRARRSREAHLLSYPSRE